MSDDLLRDALLTLDPETAHTRALQGLAVAGATKFGLNLLHARYAPQVTRPVEAFGLRFPSAVGLAAGYDKDGTAWRALGAIGFGHVEVGTVTPRPQAGNPKPRVFRLTQDQSVINRMGFPSGGAPAVRARLAADRPYGMVLGVNLGKNKETPNEEAAQDYVAGVHAFADVADYLVVNVSSPNTPGLRALQSRTRLEALLAEVVAARDASVARSTRAVPVLVKLAPDLDESSLEDAVAAIVAARVDGVIATNTTLSRDGLSSPMRDEAGGLSGAALTDKALAFLISLRSKLPSAIPIIGVGGIFRPDDVAARLDAGAVLVQVYTGMIFRGAGIVRELVEAAAKR